MMDSIVRITVFSAIVYLVVLPSANATADNIANTKQGKVKGMRQDVHTTQGKTKTIYKFLGVPFAEKPIDDLRFKPPQPLSNRRSSDYDATFLRPVCMQTEWYFDSIKGAWPEFDPKKDMSEDCLYLNIYTPSTKGKKKYPVMVHIHGGSYFDGTPIRDISPGRYLPTRDVVLVTIQYRLGVFGFFTTGDSEAPGNVGLLDQVEALKWIQQNIEGFGGDKNSVTLLGESAGGSSVGLHYLSPLSKGLFHRGIAVSGVDMSPFAYKPKSTVSDESKELLKKVNCTKKSQREAVECLRSVSSTIVNQKSQFWLMQPFVDGHVLPDKPKTLREEGRFQKLPLMSGFTSQDCSFIVEQSVKKYTVPELKKFFDNFFQQETGYAKDKAKDAYEALVSTYKLDVDNAKILRKNLIDWLSDHFMTAPTDAVLSFQSDEGAPTYMFEFAHRSKYHPKPKWMGVVHEDTTAYKFGLPFLNSKTKLKFDDDDKEVSDMLVTVFTNFAKTGEPTRPNPVHGAEWKPFESSNKAYLKIQKSPVMKNNYFPSRMSLMNTKFPKLLAKAKKEKSGLSDAAKKHVNGKSKFNRIVW